MHKWILTIIDLVYSVLILVVYCFVDERNNTTVFNCFRGFGFITFADPNSVDKVLSQGTHELDGKKVSQLTIEIQ